MRSSNPYFNTMVQSEEQRAQQAGAQTAYSQSQQANPYLSGSVKQQDSTRPMTVDDVVTKTAISLSVVILGAVLTYFLTRSNPQLGMMLTIVGAIGGFVTVLISAFRKQFGSRTVTLVYSAFEGLFLGGFSFAMTNITIGSSGTSAGLLITQAVVGTIGVFIGMIFVYKSGAIRVTPRFNRIMLGVLAGVVVLSIVNLVTAIFFNFDPLRDGGPIAIVFSLAMIVLAAISFLSDFDLADRLIRTGAPASQAWGVALGLTVTLVWLYTEILRLLSYFNRN